MRSWLLDTGPLVAYLNRRDPDHQRVAACLDGFPGELFTTSAVITEAMHFMLRSPKGASSLADFANAGGLTVFDLTQPTALTTAVELMWKYSNLPMAFADATLTLLAEHLSVRHILTLDRRGFTVYRTRDGKRFHLVLDSV